MPIDIKQLEQKLLQIQGKIKPNENANFKFWKPREAHVIRIVPHTPQFIEFMFHYEVDPNGPVVCLSSFNKKCPIDALRMNLYKSNSEEDKILAKKLKSTWRFFTPIIVRSQTIPESEIKPVWWSFSKTTYENIFRFCRDPEYGDISHPINGTDLDISLVKPQKKNEFAKTNISPKRRSSPLASSEEEIKRIIESVTDMTKEITIHSYEELQTIANNWLNSVSENKNKERSEEEEEEEEKISKSIDDVFKEINE